MGETFKISATTTPTSVPADIQWTNSDEGIATLTSTGKTGTVVAVAEGETTVTAQLQDSELNATTVITVTAA